MPFCPKLSDPPTIDELKAFHTWLNRPEEVRCAPPPLPLVANGGVAIISGSHSEAEMVPDSVRDGCSEGERRLFAVLQRLPREYVVYHEPKTGSSYASFVVIGPRFGLLVVKCCGLRPNQLAGVSSEASPVNEARGYLKTITEDCASQSGFDVLVEGSALGERDFIFPSGYLSLLSNISQGQLAERNELASSFPSSRTITSDLLESWRDNEAFTGEHVADALRFFLQGRVLAFPLKDGQIRTLRAVVHPEIRLAERPERVNDGTEGEPAFNIDIAVLDLRQERHARSLGTGHRLIYGVAGSGKTVLLIARARYLAAQHPEKRILFLCFNVTLASYLREKLTDCKNVVVHHFDEWSTKNNITRFRGESDDELGERLLAFLNNRDDSARINDTVLIDEAQDFAPVWFRCVLATMKEPLDGDLVIVGDASQGLFRRTRVSWKSLGIRAHGRTVHANFDLDRNYRNTREILELARLFASPPDDSDEDRTMCLLVDPAKARRSNGMKPVLFKESFRTREWKRVVKLVQGLLDGKWIEQKLPKPLLGREIGILYPILCGHDENEFDCFLAELEKVTPVVWLTQKHGKDLRAMVNEPGIKVQTIHSAKGLEYRATIVMWTDQLPMSWLPDYNEAENRGLMYVVLMCAVDFLAITYSRPSAFIEEIRQSGAVLLR